MGGAVPLRRISGVPFRAGLPCSCGTLRVWPRAARASNQRSLYPGATIRKQSQSIPRALIRVPARLT
jgi:hypothetical protein